MLLVVAFADRRSALWSWRMTLACETSRHLRGDLSGHVRRAVVDDTIWCRSALHTASVGPRGWPSRRLAAS
jgi:hypothetical protein